MSHLDSAALHAALQDNLAIARALQADLAVREAAAMAPDWRGRSLLWSVKARVDELRAQIAATRGVHSTGAAA